MTIIEKIIASVEKLHGGEREQVAKRNQYGDFLARVRTGPNDKFIPSIPFRESSGDR